jgi:heavy metal sensor kinase
LNTRSLKFRLISWYAGWLTVLFVVFGIFVYASLAHYLKDSLREALARRARQVADIVLRSSIDTRVLGQEIQKNFAPEANNRFTRALVNGEIIYVSGAPADGSFKPELVPLPAATGEEESFGRRTLPDGTVLLVVMVQRTAGAKRVTAEEGYSVAPLEATLHAWVMALIVGLALLILVAVLGGALLVQRSLQPVDRIISSAERISSRNLSDRLPVPDTEDEFERLSTSLNNMIRRLDEAFQQTQRFLADASHELRTPLTIVHGELEVISNRPEAGRDVRALATSALEEVGRVKNIVEGLFAVSRLDAGEAQEKTTDFDLGNLAVSTADQMSLLIEDKNLSIVCHCSERVVVHGDPARVKQVIVNLLDNAIKYTPSGGKIEVRAGKRSGKAWLEVSDDGIGIPAASLPHIFERFYRVDKARSRELGGAGLGLSIVKSIVAAHNGQVTADSTEGRGTRFTVELPLALPGGH